MDTKKLQVILTAKGLFKTQGFHPTSIQDIIDTCTISKGTFYNYFSSKNAFMIAYLKTARHEEITRRNELIRGNDATNKAIFTKQILVRLDVASEFALREIYEHAFHSNDPGLKTFIEERITDELGWLAKRIVDLYGKGSTSYCSDCAVLFHGMMQHMLYAGKALKRPLNSTLMVQYIVRRLDDIMEGLNGSDDQFLTGVTFAGRPQTQLGIHKDLTTLKQMITKERKAFREHLDFLLEEVTAGQPRFHLLQSSIYTCGRLVETDKEKAIMQMLRTKFDEMKC